MTHLGNLHGNFELDFFDFLPLLPLLLLPLLLLPKISSGCFKEVCVETYCRNRNIAG